jgi:hypothetical protein
MDMATQEKSGIHLDITASTGCVDCAAAVLVRFVIEILERTVNHLETGATADFEQSKVSALV